MDTRLAQRVMGAMLIGGLLPVSVAAQTAPASPPSEGERIPSLAQQFDVPPRFIEELRGKGRGWGEITTELSLAEQLSKSDPTTYPNTAEALPKVEDLRAQGKGWGNVARELGLQLGPAIKAGPRYFERGGPPGPPLPPGHGVR